MPPLVLLIGVVEVQIARKFFSKAEGSTAFCFMLRPGESGLFDGMMFTPRVGEVDIFQVYGLKTVVTP